jgi:hypothetical protein
VFFRDKISFSLVGSTLNIASSDKERLPLFYTRLSSANFIAVATLNIFLLKDTLLN